MAPLPPLRSKLFLLAAVGVVPMLILSLVLGYFLLRHEKETFREAARARNRTFLKAVDSQILGYLGTLRALAASASLERGNLESFDEETQRVLASQPQWRNVLLLDPSGQQLMNLRYPYGAPLPNEAQSDNPSFKRVLADKQPVIGNLNPGPVSSLPGIAVRIPVMRDGALQYVLELILEPAALVKSIDAGAYPPSWVVALVDRNGLFIARRPGPHQGEHVAPGFWEAAQRVPEGWYEGKTLEGRGVYTAFK
ncbi:MAG: cache domain-containing protein, partial [Variovorax sp.]